MITYLLFIILFATITRCEDCPAEAESVQQSAETALLRLPRINLGKYIDGSTTEKNEIASLVDSSLHDFGTLSLFNHGIPSELFDRMHRIGFSFFHQDVEYKKQFLSNGVGSPGYELFKSLNAAYSFVDTKSTGDLAEMYALFWNNKSNDYRPPLNERPVELQAPEINQYILEMERITKAWYALASHALLNVTSDTQGDYQDFFNKLHNNTRHWQLRLFYYPALESLDDYVDDSRVGQHLDYLGFTLFRPGNVRGLQNKVGDVWIDCETAGDYAYDIFVNTGQIFNSFTNRHWKPNWHRVVARNEERITFTVFTGPNKEAVIEPIAGCDACTKDEPLYEATTVGQHDVAETNRKTEFRSKTQAY